MKTKNILMSVLLATGFIAAKAATGYPPELALVSQPVLVYNYNSITVYYDVQNIGDYAYRGNIYIYLSPDNGYYYAEKYVRVCPGRIKRVAIEIPAYRPNPSWSYTIMPYYELDDELYSFTTFEYFEPLRFHWNGYHDEPWVVINVPPRVRRYNRPGDYRYYYDGFRPPMPPPGHAYGPGMPPPPMNPMHHTYNYHYNNGGYPGYNGGGHVAPPAPNHDGNNVNPPAPDPNNGGNGTAPAATVRPKPDGGSMSHGNSNVNGGSNNGGNTPPPPPSNNGGSSSGRTGNSSNSGRVNNSNNSGSSHSGTVNSGSNSGRTGNSGNVSRPSNNSNSNGTSGSGSNSGRTGNSGSSVRSGSNSGSSSGTSTGSNSRSGSSSNSSSSNTRSGSNSGRSSR